jgi:hypothetical protein
MGHATVLIEDHSDDPVLHPAADDPAAADERSDDQA